MKKLALLLFGVITPFTLLFSQGDTNDCDGWDFDVDYYYVTPNDECDANVLHVGVDISGTDFDDDEFYIYIQWDFDYLIDEFWAEPGFHDFEIEGVPANGTILVSVATHHMPPNCSDIQFYDVTGGNDGTGQTDNWAEVASTENASCGLLADGSVEFYSPNYSEYFLWYGGEIDIEPNPGGITYSFAENDNWVLTGFPAGEYCITFTDIEQSGCWLSDEECFTIGSDQNGIFEVEGFDATDPQCDYWVDADNSSWVQVEYPNSFDSISGFEGSATNTETGDSFDLEFHYVNEEDNEAYVGNFELGNYCLELTNPEHGCSTSFCLDIPDAVDPTPVYQVDIIESVDTDNENASVVFELISGWSEHEQFILLPSQTLYHTGDTIAGLSAGVHFIQSCGFSVCCYETPFEIPEFAGLEGCTDPNACNYNEDANVDNGTCSYLDGCGDLTGDNEVDIADLLMMLGQMGCVGDDCTADYNGDSIVNLVDLLIFLGLL